MPVISRFYGIIIKMYFNDHLPAHFHAMYGEYSAIIDVYNGNIIEGDLPKRAKKLINEWWKINKDSIIKMWESKEFNNIKGLE